MAEKKTRALTQVTSPVAAMKKFHDAVKKGDLDALKELFAAGLKPYRMQSFLLALLEKDDLEMARYAFEHVPEGEFKHGLLGYVRSLPILRLLVKHGLPVGAKDSYGNLPENLVGAHLDFFMRIMLNSELGRMRAYLRLNFICANHQVKYTPYSIDQMLSQALDVDDEDFRLFATLLRENGRGRISSLPHLLSRIVRSNLIVPLELLCRQKQVPPEELHHLLFCVADVEMAEALCSLGAHPDEPDEKGDLPHQFYMNLFRQNAHGDDPDREMLTRIRDIGSFYEQVVRERHPEKLPGADTRRFKHCWVTMSQLSPVPALAYDPREKRQFRISYKDEKYTVSDRFMQSLTRLLEFAENIFNYFSVEEVFTRINERYPDLRMRLTIDTEDHVLLAIVRDDELYPPADSFIAAMEKLPGLDKTEYYDGVFYAHYHYEEDQLKLNDGHAYQRCALLMFPVDGYGGIHMVPGLLCTETNQYYQMMNRRFQTILSPAADDAGRLYPIQFMVTRALPYDSYVKAGNQLQIAGATRASVNELMEVEKMVDKVVPTHDVRVALSEELHNLCGDPCAFYGITSLSNIQVPFRRLLPVLGSVRDLLDFLAKVQLRADLSWSDRIKISKFVGEMMSREFNLQGVFDSNEDLEQELEHVVPSKAEMSALPSRRGRTSRSQGRGGGRGQLRRFYPPV